MRRPYAPGAAPREGLVSFENYDERKFVEDAACAVWAKLIYDHILPEDVLEAYEMAESGHKVFYRVALKADKNGNVVISSIEKQYAFIDSKPKNYIHRRSNDRYNWYISWFDTAEEAEAFIAEAMAEGLHIL